MPRVALIQDGTEVARQKYADVADFFRDCCTALSNEGLTYSLEIFTDDAVGFLLNGISQDQFDCLVFASNALLSDGVRVAVVRHGQSLKDYLSSGGGLILLHQIRPGVEDMLPPDLRPEVADRADWGEDTADAEDADDVLLRYPEPVAVDRLCDSGHDFGPRPLFWKTLRRESLPPKLWPILTQHGGGRGVLLARTRSRSPERAVIATMPLDWQRNTGLVKNALRYACLGEPRRLLWRRESTPRTEIFLRWIYMDGATAVRPVPTGDLAGIDQWLLATIGVCIVQPDDFDQIRARPEVQTFLSRGGTLITAGLDAQQGVSRVAALVGNYPQWALARQLQAELEAIPGWDTLDNAFKLRNIVCALAYLRDRGLRDPVISIAPEDLAHLAPGIRQRLTEPQHRADLSSSIALGEVLSHLTPGPRDNPEYFAWMHATPLQDGFDVALQIRALTSLWQRRPDSGFVAAAAAHLRERASQLRSIAPVVRIMDAVAMLDQDGLLVADPPAAEALGDTVCDILEQLQGDSRFGWMSVEATADITRGMVTLLGRVAAPDSPTAHRLAVHLGAGVTTLRRAVSHYERDASGVAWLARVAHAIILADARFPIGLQRLASLDWPDHDAVSDIATAWEESLVADLAVQNKELRGRNQQVEETIRSREQELEELQLPARVGRAAATTATLAVLTAGVVLFLLEFSPRSLWQVLTNVGWLLPGLLALLTGAFHLLARWNLLAEPAVNALAAIGRAMSSLPDPRKPKDTR